MGNTPASSKKTPFLISQLIIANKFEIIISQKTLFAAIRKLCTTRRSTLPSPTPSRLTSWVNTTTCKDTLPSATYRVSNQEELSKERRQIPASPLKTFGRRPPLLPKIVKIRVERKATDAGATKLHKRNLNVANHLATSEVARQWLEKRVQELPASPLKTFPQLTMVEVGAKLQDIAVLTAVHVKRKDKRKVKT